MKVLPRKQDIPEPWKGKNISVKQGNLRGPGTVVDAMKGMDVAFHIGEIRSTSTGNAVLNIALVEGMVVALEPSGARRMVFVRPLSAAGIPLAIPATEDTPAAQVLRDQQR